MFSPTTLNRRIEAKRTQAPWLTCLAISEAGRLGDFSGMGKSVYRGRANAALIWGHCDQDLSPEVFS